MTPRQAWGLAQVPINIASRGLLPGVQVDWLEPWRRELDDIRLQALEVIGWAGLAMGGGQLTSVERAARSLIDVEPYRESGYVLLMEAFRAQGNIAEGLRVFERLRALLRDELGTAPSPDALAAHQRLLHPEARAGRGHGAGPAPPRDVALPAELACARRAWTWSGARRAAGRDRRMAGPGRRRTRQSGCCCSAGTRGWARPACSPRWPAGRTRPARWCSPDARPTRR